MVRGFQQILDPFLLAHDAHITHQVRTPVLQRRLPKRNLNSFETGPRANDKDSAQVLAAAFDGGRITSNGGVMLLAAAERLAAAIRVIRTGSRARWLPPLRARRLANSIKTSR